MDGASANAALHVAQPAWQPGTPDPRSILQAPRPQSSAPNRWTFHPIKLPPSTAPLIIVVVSSLCLLNIVVGSPALPAPSHPELFQPYESTAEQPNLSFAVIQSIVRIDPSAVPLFRSPGRDP